MNILVVGAGFSGAVMARQLAEAGHKVLVIDKRKHIGGNAFDELDSNGVLVHRYGPHIFHTNSKKIFEYLSKFTEWRKYEHRVLSSISGKLYPIPINRTTLSLLYGRTFTEKEAQSHLDSVRINFDHPKTSEEVVLNSVGTELCDLFFRGYTLKQWGLSLAELSAGVAARIPTRTSDDDRYFDDQYQFMPLNGYTKLFKKMLSHKSIEIRLGLDYFEEKENMSFQHLVYTGPIDKFFNYRFGELPYRSLQFEFEHLDDSSFQPVATVNYPNEFGYTRITEMKKLTGQTCDGTTLVTEYPTNHGDPYYPIPTLQNATTYKKYQALAGSEEGTSFVGRLAQYKYFNMDQVVGSALEKSEILISKLGT
jgi:UDP-galactopyranose mutase